MNAPIPQSAFATRPNGAVSMGFNTLESFEFMQRTARMFTQSSMVPTAYRAVIEKGYGDRATREENPSALPNCIIALNMSQRMNADPLMIMQNLHVIEGRPSWSSQFIIAAINSCGRFSPLRFDIQAGQEIDATCTTFEWENGKKKAIVTKTKVKNTSCIAWVLELATNTRLESPKVTMEMAVNEGWYGKNGSKWVTMPDLMLRYRSAAFFGRIYAPELLMGLPSAEESHDTIVVSQQEDGTYSADPIATSAPATKSPAPDVQDVLPACPDDVFATELVKYTKIMATGKKTPSQVIATAQAKYTLTEAQKAAIHKAAMPVGSRQPEPPPGKVDADGVITPVVQPTAKTFDEVMTMVCAAKTEDALYVAAEWIDRIANKDEVGTLNSKFNERLNEIRGAQA